MGFANRKADFQPALDAFRAALGPAGMVADADRMTGHLRDWGGDYRGRTLCVLRPASVAEVQAVVRLCRAHRLAVIPQGGNTGLVNGGFSDDDRGNVIVSLARLDTIRRLDGGDFTLEADAGCILQKLKDAAEEADCLFPLALGAQGSCQIGGNAATNAGGINVLRYGMARDLILGLEVVLPDGEIWNGITGLRKDNRGYDLKQLFIGAEGTLGIITGVEVKLFPKPSRSEVAYLGCASFADAMALMAMARAVCSDLVTGFEVIGHECLALARFADPAIAFPVAESIPVHVVLECASSEAIDLRAMIEALIGAAIEKGLVVDAVLAESIAQARAFWAVREGLVEGQGKSGFHVRTDLSVRLHKVPSLIAEARAFVADHHPAWLAQAYGHAGDGNIHFNVMPPKDLSESAARAEGRKILSGLYDIVAGLDGSLSAEHGIGRSRRDVLWPALSPVQRRLLRAVKSAFDPDNMMNPGCLIPEGNA
ncbi:MAG: FAD-binding oxidoreductase [Pseudomonadota bacterium]